MVTSERTLSVDGNRLTFLPEGRQRLDALIAMIDSATTSVRLLFYIYTADGTGAAVRSALIRAIDRGLAVSVLIDGFGSGRTPESYFRELRQKGAKYCRFNPSYGRQYLLRNHQKLLLVDGETDQARIMIGGFNIEDSYFATIEDKGWRDVGLLVEGPAASRVVPYYDALISWALNRRSRLKTLRAVVRRFSEREGPLQWQYGGPMQVRSPWALATLHDIAAANDLEMIAAYFAPMGGIIKRIGNVGRRGRARIITAGKSDNRATIYAARSTYSRLLKRGVQVFEYQLTRLHSKLLVMDDVVHIGSSNFDLRSLYLNLEMMLRVHDPGFAIMMRSYFEHELGQSIEITSEAHEKASWLQRLRWRIAWFLVTSIDYTVTRRLALRVP